MLAFTSKFVVFDTLILPCMHASETICAWLKEKTMTYVVLCRCFLHQVLSTVTLNIYILGGVVTGKRYLGLVNVLSILFLSCAVLSSWTLKWGCSHSFHCKVPFLLMKMKNPLIITFFNFICIVLIERPKKQRFFPLAYSSTYFYVNYAYWKLFTILLKNSTTLRI